MAMTTTLMILSGWEAIHDFDVGILISSYLPPVLCIAFYILFRLKLKTRIIPAVSFLFCFAPHSQACGDATAGH